MSIASLTKEMISTPLRNRAEILFHKRGWSDVIEQFRSARDRRVYDAPRGSGRDDYIRRRLGHIIVNPHNENSTEALKKVYVYATDVSPDCERIDNTYINKSPANTDAFMQDLISRAKEARQQLLGRGAPDPTDLRDHAARDSHIIVHGKRGCGKTFFLNHLLAKYSETLDEEKVLWVRLNLVEGFEGDIPSDFKFDLVHRIYAQTAKIVLRYYDPESEHYRKDKPKPRSLPLMESLRDFVREKYKDKESRIYRMDELVNMQYAFGTKGVDPQISPALVPRPIGEALFHLVLQKGYSVICVLDGLDRLESSAHHKRRFQQLFDAAVNLTNSQGNLGIAIVSVTRTNTLNTFPDISRRPNQYISGETQAFKVFPVDPDAIVQRRIEFLRDNVRQLAKGQAWSIEDWPGHLDRFLAFLKNPLDNSDGVLLRAFGDNRRAQMQVVQLRYYDFTMQETGRSYLFLESLVLAGQRFPPRAYRYMLTAKGNWRLQFVGATAFDNHLLPSGFTFPYIEWELHGGHPPQIPHLEGVLLGLRLLQILNANENLMNSPSSDVDRMTAKEMSDILFTLFGYSRELIMHFIKQFEEFELLSLGGPDFPVYLESTRQHLLMLPKGQHTLRQFLYDIAYLNLCAMRVPIAFHNTDSRYAFFMPASLDIIIDPDPNWDLNVGESLVQWVTAKIINSCAMFRLLSDINRFQEQRYRSQLELLDQRQRRIAQQAKHGQEGVVSGMFKFSERLRTQIPLQIEAMVHSIENDDRRATEVVLRLVKEYWSYWGSK